MANRLRFPNSEYVTDEVLDEVEKNNRQSREYQRKTNHSSENSNEDYIIPETTPKLPFEKISDDKFSHLFYEHNLDAYFDEIDVREHANERATEFQNLTPEEKEIIEKAIVQYANDNNGEVLFAMRLTGREADRTLADELEEKYGVNADKIRIATEMFRSTYTMWELNNLTVSVANGNEPTESELNEIRQKLITLDEAANYLENFQIPATHVTNDYAGSQISKSEILRKSDSGDSSHYEGDGVYAGVLGSYREWNSGDVFEFNVPYADTFPVIVSYTYPKAMVNILGEGLDIQKRDEVIATASGLQQWRQLEYEGEVLEWWKLDLLEEALGVPVEVVMDTEGIPTVIADTDKEPIHWAMVCRSLRIPRFIPKSELSKSDILYNPELKQTKRERIENESEQLPTREGLILIGSLTEAMNQQNIDEVLRMVDILEKRSCEVLFDPKLADGIDETAGIYTFRSGWANDDNWENYFGGALELDTMLTDEDTDEGVRVSIPLRNGFIIGENYYDSLDRKGADKPDKAIIHLPVDTLSVSYSEVDDKEDITSYEATESLVVWRMARQGEYSNNCFISDEQEALIKDKLGDEVYVERNVITPGFISGEYDRLVIPRSISALKATSLAYTLRLMEVVYQDQVDELNMIADGAEREALMNYKQELAERQELSENVESFITQIHENQNLSEKDKLLAEYFVSLYSSEYDVTSFLEERHSLNDVLEGDFPESEVLTSMTPRKEWFIRESSMHGTPHILRVMVNMELLTRLVRKNISEDKTVDLQALEIATMLHDTRRHTDDYDDYEHGERAAEFLETLLNSEDASRFAGANLELAKRIMTEHSLDDYDGMTVEEDIFKDADAMDRYRFRSGPDTEFLRTKEVSQIDNSAYQLAELSKFLLENGYTRTDSVIKAARILRLTKD